MIRPATSLGAGFYMLGMLAVLGYPATATADPTVTLDVDWPTYMARQDLISATLPTAWDSGSFVGNGLFGAMIYEDVDGTLRFDLGRSDVWDHQMDGGLNAGAAGKTRLLIGALHLVTAGAIQSGSARVDLWNAEARGTVQTKVGTVEWRCFAHAVENVFVIELRTTGGEAAAAWSFAPATARSPWGTDPPHPNPAPATLVDGPVQIVSQSLVAGGGFATSRREEVLSADHRVLYVSIGWDAAGAGAVSEATGAVNRAQAEGAAALEATHRAWWQAYWPASFLSLGDPALERFYWLQMYKLASATRADRPIYDLLGPWPTRARWPGLWWDLNTQMTYWPVYTANRLELGQSLTRTLDAALQSGALADNEPNAAWRGDSAAISTVTSIDLRSAYPLYEFCDLPFAAHDYWLQYRYSMDEPTLRRLFPLLRRAMNFYLHRITNTPVAGRANLPVGRSPESATGPNPTIDVGFARWGLQALLDADSRLGIGDPQRALWQSTLAALVEFPTDDNGLQLASGIPLGATHRAFSHLFPIYPLHVLNRDHADQLPVMAKSIDRWAGAGATGLLNPGSMDKSGFSYTGAALLYAAIGRGDSALTYLELAFRTDLGGTGRITPNTFYVDHYFDNDNPTSETSPSVAAAIQDMLLQSWGGRVRVFPALPGLWRDVGFFHLRAEGAFVVSARRQAGKTEFVELQSLAGEPCVLASDLEEPWEAVGAREFVIGRLESGVATIDVRRGESVILRTRGSAPVPSIGGVTARDAGPPAVDLGIAAAPETRGCGCDVGRKEKKDSVALYLLLAVGCVLSTSRTVFARRARRARRG